MVKERTIQANLLVAGDTLSNHPNNMQIRKKIQTTLKEHYIHLSDSERKQKFGRCGEQNGMFANTHTEEAKNKISTNGKEKRRINAKRRIGNSIEEIYGEDKAKEVRQKLSELGKKKTKDKNPFYGRTHTEETKQILREQAVSRFNNMTLEDRSHHKQIRLVKIEGKTYYGVGEAARQLGVSPGTICYRIKSNSKNYKNYAYV